MEVNTEAWSVGKYAKRSHTIHINSDAQVEATEVMALNLIVAVSADGLTIDLTNVSPGTGIAGKILKVTSDTGVEWREIDTNGAGSNQLTLAAGNAFTNMANANLQNARYEVFDRGFPSGQSNVDFFVDIPNYIGYPEHKRCLVQLQNVTVMPKATLENGNDMTADTQTRPLLCGLELEGVSVQNSYTNTIGFDPLHFVPGSVNTSQLVCVFPLQKFNATRHYTTNRSITDDGVLIGTPFGKRLRLRIKNMTTNDALVMQPNDNDGDADDEIKNNPVHVTLRLLFLDDDEIPDR
jgi:hypothetical protein